MKDKTATIPIQTLEAEVQAGISVSELLLRSVDSVQRALIAHRHDFHFFMLINEGQVEIEIDFERFVAPKASVIYVHPFQVHRFLQVDFADTYILAVKNDFLSQDNIQLLEQIAQRKSPIVQVDIFPLLRESVALSLQIDMLAKAGYSAGLVNSCATFIALFVACATGSKGEKQQQNRLTLISNSFFYALNQHYRTLKSPKEYAVLLYVSTSYLNECVKKTTGFSVSYHIQQRILLEAKRLLFHSEQAVKEVAVALGFEDIAYFSRFFKKHVGMSALAFRNTNHE